MQAMIGVLDKLALLFTGPDKLKKNIKKYLHGKLNYKIIVFRVKILKKWPELQKKNLLSKRL